VKTHKCIEAAQLQTRGHFGGITVSTLAEARHFAAGGFEDITWAVPLPPQRALEAAELAESIERLQLLVDDATSVDALESAAACRGRTLRVVLKLDCGYGRAGVDPQGDEGLSLARRLQDSPGLDFRGILAHAGHSYSASSVDEIRGIAREEREVTTAFASRLRAAGVAVQEVSIGSTPTCVHTDDLGGVTEVRPGNYAFFDAFQAALGSCTLADAALTVLATVIGSYPARGQLLLDAGALALSKDGGATHLDPDCGFGALWTADRAEALPGLRLAKLSQEHGQVQVLDAALFERFPVGSRVQVIANHSCLTSALHERYVVIEGDRAVDEWRPVRGW